MIVEYIFEGLTPEWIKDGGHFMDPDTNTMIGIADNCPENVTILTRQTLKNKVQDIHQRYPILELTDDGMYTMSIEQVNQMVDFWCQERNEE